MSNTIITDVIIEPFKYQNRNELEEVTLTQAFFVGSNAFSYCKSLKSVRFGSDITRISAGAFYDCSALTDVYFDVLNNDKIIEIEYSSFPLNVKFHIFSWAKDNKYLLAYAQKRGIKVEFYN